MQQRAKPEIPDVDVRGLLRGIAEKHRDKLQLARAVPQLHRTLLRRERTRLAGKLGADHPRVRSMDARLERTAAVARDVERAADIQHVERTPVGKDEILVHGRVQDQHGRPLQGGKVVLVDERSKVLDVEPTKTDVCGCYAILLDRAEAQELAEQGARAAVVDPRGGILREAEQTLDSKRRRQFQSIAVPKEKVHGRVARHKPEGSHRKRSKAPGGSKWPPVDKIDGIGPVRAQRLTQHGIGDVKTFYEAPEPYIREIVGSRDIPGMKKQAEGILKEHGWEG